MENRIIKDFNNKWDRLCDCINIDYSHIAFIYTKYKKNIVTILNTPIKKVKVTPIEIEIYNNDYIFLKVHRQEIENIFIEKNFIEIKVNKDISFEIVFE